MENKQRRRFSREFKIEAVQLANLLRRGKRVNFKAAPHHHRPWATASVGLEEGLRALLGRLADSGHAS